MTWHTMDSAPIDGTRILLRFRKWREGDGYGGDGRVFIGEIRLDGWGVDGSPGWGDSGSLLDKVDGWMPLPDPEAP